MKTILVTSLPGYPIMKNIGDYIQALAVKQFIPNIDGYVDREEMSSFESDDRCKAVCNGCFVWNYTNWPPSPMIIPLFTSMHIFPTIAEKFMTEENIAYFKEHGPIGCRDLGTLQLMQNHNIPAYYSSCLTLTLGITYKADCKHNRLLFVDPIIPDPVTQWNPLHWGGGDIFALLKIVNTCIINPYTFIKLFKKSFFKTYGNTWGHRETKGIRNIFKTIVYVATFIRIYSSKFDLKTLVEADIISNIYFLKHGENDNESLMKVSEGYLNKYTEYPLVVTSRIHCALPCIGIGIPVIFVINNLMESKEVKFNSPGRFDGIIDFFRVLRVEGEHITTEDEFLGRINKIDSSTMIVNKDNWKPYAEKLAKQVTDFFKN